MIKYTRKVLIASGDSSTFYNRYTHPFWPEILANKLDMKCINIGRGGKGNEFIYNQMIDKLCTTKRIGLAVCLWSEVGRWDFPYLEASSKIDNDGNVIRGVIKKYKLLKSMRWYHAFQNHCELHNIKYLQMQAFHSLRGQPTKELLDSAQFNFIDDNKFIGWPPYEQLGGKTAWNKLDDVDPDRTKLRVSTEDLHPNDKGHEYIAEIMYDTYKEIYL